MEKAAKPFLRRRMVRAALLLAALWGALQAWALLPNGADAADSAAWRKKDDGRMLIFAHRGGAGLAPENTMAAFVRAAQEGVDGLEMDAQLTADGHLAVFHDAQVNRTTESAGAVSDFSLAELQALKIRHAQGEGARVAALREVFDAFAPTPLLFVVEIKDRDEKAAEAAQKLADLIDEYPGLSARVMVASFGGEGVNAYRRLRPDAPTSAHFFEAVGDVVKQAATLMMRSSAVALQLPPSFNGLSLMNEGLVRRANAAGQAAHFWTINDEAGFETAIAAGADGVITDRPDIARLILKQAGFENLPPSISPAAEESPQAEKEADGN